LTLSVVWTRTFLRNDCPAVGASIPRAPLARSNGSDPGVPYRLGIVEACTMPEELMPAAMELAQTIASKSPVSTRMGKHTLNVIEDMSLRDGYRYEQDMTAQIGKTEDAKEAQLAFRERWPTFVD
jgi:enoyl-CoA hydratase/carnithine racemase